MSEDEVKAIWEGLKGSQIFDGQKSIFVAFPGIKSRFGPDFRSAVLFIDNLKVEGDVECHVFSSDWFKHRHNLDDNFSSVKIHVVWEDDIDTDIITISLSKIKSINSSKSFLCAENTEEQKREELKNLAYVRFLRKAERISERISEVGDERALFEFTAEAFGYEKFRNTLLLFAREFSGKIMDIDDATIADIASNFLSSFRLIKSPPTRPQNEPEKRIKSLVLFYKKNHPLSQKILEFFDKRYPYNLWQRSFLVSNLGPGRFRTVMANVFIPYILLYRNKEEVIEFFSSFPQEEDNRIINSGSKILNIIKKLNMVEAQGLIEIFKSRCSRYLCYLCRLRIE